MDSDIESDGAECQKHHLCKTDRDCVANLGWDYACESVAGLTSQWPSFDGNANELPLLENIVNLRSQFSARGHGVKRCVYRGRGSPCQNPYDGANYSGTDKRSFQHCSYSNYCQSFIEGVEAPLFNNRIARFGKSVKHQNDSSVVPEDDLDTFGLHSRILGRPYAWQGRATIPADIRPSFYRNKVFALCLPGRNPEDTDLESAHKNRPSNLYTGDKVHSIGHTPQGLGGDEYLSSCSILNNDGEYIYKDAPLGALLSDPDIKRLAGRQAVATNALQIFESPDMADTEILKNFEGGHIEEVALQENRCLRAPGSTCFSATECASNHFLANVLASINPDDSNVTTLLNKYEVQFWQEGLVCSGGQGDLAQNRCCRENNKPLTIGTPNTTYSGLTRELSFVDFDTSQIPVLGGIDLNDRRRYHRINIAWDLMTGSQKSSYPPLAQSFFDSCDSTLDVCTPTDKTAFQYNTFSAIAERTCCSGHWVRKFHKDNGGGHGWHPDKLQSVPKESLKCLNWQTCSGSTCGGVAADGYFSCEHVEDPDDPPCLMRATSLDQARPYFDFFASLELTGVPTVPVKTKDWDDIRCHVNPDNQSLNGNAPPPNLIGDADVEKSEYEDESLGDHRYFSAGDPQNFNADHLKMVFSPDEIACCLPAGSQVPPDSNPDLCCTGHINQTNNRCQLPDYTNLSLYTNRYVSSVAKDESLSRFDRQTGYLKSASDVIRVACNQDLCESGHVAKGIALSSLRFAGHPKHEKQLQRFVDGDDEANNFSGMADLYNDGLRWNTHVYCIPADSELGTVINCAPP